MFEIPENILEYFFNEINKNSKYEVIFQDKGIIIKCRAEEEYYKPIIIAKDLEELRYSLINFVNALNEFYTKNKCLQPYHDLSYFLNNLFFNMTVSDARDLAAYINKRAFFFSNTHFEEYSEKKLIESKNNVNVYAQRIADDPGLETPYILAFSIEIDGVNYPLPLIRYAFDQNNVCHIYAIQFGRDRYNDVQNIEYKKIVNEINSGIHKYRNVSPSFVVTFSLFLKLLYKYNVTKIVIPCYLFGRYRKCYKAQSIEKGDAILTRIIDNFILLIERMEYQFPFFQIDYYPEEIDSYTHISLKRTKNNKY